MNDSIRCIVGLGNPGAAYEHSRHNAGFDYVECLATRQNARWQAENRYKAEVCAVQLNGQKIWLLKPMNYMNRSGLPVASFCNFYKITPAQILVAHDELDLPVGTAKFKQGGGHGGHNGLRDIIAALANDKTFYRLRLGIGHPGHTSQVASYVLAKGAEGERNLRNQALNCALDTTALAVAGDWPQAMNQLHSFKAE